MKALTNEWGVRILLLQVKHSSILDPVERMSLDCIEERLKERISGILISIEVDILKARKNAVIAIFSYSTLSVGVDVDVSARYLSSTFMAT